MIKESTIDFASYKETYQNDWQCFAFEQQGAFTCPAETQYPRQAGSADWLLGGYDDGAVDFGSLREMFQDIFSFIKRPFQERPSQAAS